MDDKPNKPSVRQAVREQVARAQSEYRSLGDRFHDLARRQSALPAAVRQKIHEELRNMGPIVNMLIDQKDAGAADKIGEFSVAFTESLVSLAETIFTEAANRNRVVTLS